MWYASDIKMGKRSSLRCGKSRKRPDTDKTGKTMNEKCSFFCNYLHKKTKVYWTNKFKYRNPKVNVGFFKLSNWKYSLTSREILRLLTDDANLVLFNQGLQGCSEQTWFPTEYGSFEIIRSAVQATHPALKDFYPNGWKLQ